MLKENLQSKIYWNENAEKNIQKRKWMEGFKKIKSQTWDMIPSSATLYPPSELGTSLSEFYGWIFKVDKCSFVLDSARSVFKRHFYWERSYFWALKEVKEKQAGAELGQAQHKLALRLAS